MPVFLGLLGTSGQGCESDEGGSAPSQQQKIAMGKPSSSSARQFIDDEAQEDKRFALDDDDYDYEYYDNADDHESDNAPKFSLTQYESRSEHSPYTLD